MSERYPVLIGDIGGTNIRFGILLISKDINEHYEILERKTFHTQNYPSLETAFEEFLSKFKDTPNYPKYGAIGVPAPVNNNEILHFTNIPHWKKVNGDEFAKKFNMKKFEFLNDFRCNAYGVQTKLKLNEDYIIINDVPPQENGTIGIIGPGSGLGVSFLEYQPGSQYYIIGSSKGGHMDFFSKNKKLYDLAEFTKKLLGQKLLSIERLCSGQGLVPMYKFLHSTEKDIKRDEELGKKIDELTDLHNFLEVDKLNIELVTKGLKDECPLCKKVLELFVEVFGEVAGNMSLFCLPSKGLYLVGGLSKALEKEITKNNKFMEHFLNKDDFAYLLKTFPIYLVKNGNLGILGAAEFARRTILEYEK